MPRSSTTSRQRADGQVMVLFALGLTALIAMVGLVIDGGNAWAQQRITQAGNDAAAEAGAVVLAERLAGKSAPAGGWDAVVYAAIQARSGDNGITAPNAWYTDICGVLLRPDGTRAANASEAARVGAGALPVNNNTNPDCPNAIVGPVAGVQVEGQKVFDTFVARAIGFSQMTATTSATAVTGFLQGVEGETLLPVTAPVTVVTCDKSGKAVNTSTPWPMNEQVIVPLCKELHDPGSVGWIDWYPKAGGASELAEAILHPNGPAIPLPSWQYVTETGAINSGQVEDAFNYWAGQIILFPLFDLTCNDDPDFSQVASGPLYGCPSGSVGGSGSNQWYRFPAFAAFELEWAYTQGVNKAVCDPMSVGVTQCFVGKFVDLITSGTVGPGVGGGTTVSSLIGVQLIK